jgi:hypothetical protein
VLLSGLGTGEPHVEQKSERKPVSSTHEEMPSLPASHRKWFSVTMVAVFDEDPLCFRQSPQWH